MIYPRSFYGNKCPETMVDGSEGPKGTDFVKLSKDLRGNKNKCTQNFTTFRGVHNRMVSDFHLRDINEIVH